MQTGQATERDLLAVLWDLQDEFAMFSTETIETAQNCIFEFSTEKLRTHL